MVHSLVAFNTTQTQASRLGLNTPISTQLASLPDLIDPQQAPSHPLWQRLIAGFLLASSLVVHTGQALAQYQSNNPNNASTANSNGAYNNAPRTGYAPNGQLYLAGQPYQENQAHIDARNVANATLYNIIAQGLSVPTTANPGFVHETLAQIEANAANPGGGGAGAVRSATVIYFGTKYNIYGENGSLTVQPGTTTPITNATAQAQLNFATTKDILTNAPNQGYQTIVAPPNAPGTAAVPYVNGPYLAKVATGSDAGLASALFYNAPNSTVFTVAQVNQSPSGAANATKIGGGVAANLNQNATQVNHLSALAGGLTYANTVWLTARTTNATHPNGQNSQTASDQGSAENGGGGFYNPNANSAGSANYAGSFNSQYNFLETPLGQSAGNAPPGQGNNGYNSGYNNDYNTSNSGYSNSNPYGSISNQANTTGDFGYFNRQDQFVSINTSRLQNPAAGFNGNNFSGTGDAGNAALSPQAWAQQMASSISQTAIRQDRNEGYQNQANALNLSNINPNELFGRGYNLFTYTGSAADRALLLQLQNGELTPGTEAYNRAVSIAQQSYRNAYYDHLANNTRLEYSLSAAQHLANQLNLDGINPSELFRDGFDLYKYAQSQEERDLLRQLQNGQLSVGSDDYNRAVAIAIQRYKDAYADNLRTGAPRNYSIADTQNAANKLNLDHLSAQELFAQGFELYTCNATQNPHCAAQNALLLRLQKGELSVGSAEYNEAMAIAKDRLRQAYAHSLEPPPPPPKPSKWKLLVAAIVAAVAVYFTAGAASGWVGGLMSSLATTAGATAATAGLVGSIATTIAYAAVSTVVGSVVSTTIITGDLGAGLSAGFSALANSISGNIASNIVKGILNYFLPGLAELGTAATIAVNALTNAIANVLNNGGSFEDAMVQGLINAVVDAVQQQAAGYIGNPDNGFVGAGALAAHAVVGCASAAARGQDCGAGAVGAVVGELVAPVIFGAGFDPLNTGTVQGIRDASAYFAGVAGGAAAAATGSSSDVQSNFNTGQQTGANAAENNALGRVFSSVPSAVATFVNNGWAALNSAGQAALTACAANQYCAATLPAAVIAYIATQTTATPPPSLADQIPGYGGNAPPPDGSIPPFPITSNNQPNNTGGNQTKPQDTSGVTGAGSGYGAGGTPNVGNGIVTSTVPPSITDGNGRLPPVTGENGGAIERPATPNPNQTAEQFARDAFNGQTPTAIRPLPGGGWSAALPDGTYVTYRPSGQASSSTSDTTASVDVNSPAVNAINNGKPAKFKFPKL